MHFSLNEFVNKHYCQIWRNANAQQLRDLSRMDDMNVDSTWIQLVQIKKKAISLVVMFMLTFAMLYAMFNDLTLR